MKLICDCGKEIQGYDDMNFNGDKIWSCDCGKQYVCDSLGDEDDI